MNVATLLVLVGALAWRLAGTPAVIVIAAFGPAAVYVTLVALLDRRAREPVGLWITAFLWGAVVAATVAAALNERLQGWIGTVVPPAEAQVLAPMLGAPVVEEAAKAATLVVLLLVWRRPLRGARAGIVVGAVVGLGFAAAENVLYLTLAVLQAGHAGLVHGVYLRGILYGLSHPAFTATFGAALGYARATSSRGLAVLVPLVGFAIAALQHVVWNTVASEAIVQVLCNPLAPGGACQSPPSPWSLYLTVPLLVVAFLGPGIATLLVIAILSRRDSHVAAATARVR